VLDNYAFVRTSGYLPGSDDAYVSLSMVKKFGLRKGDVIIASSAGDFGDLAGFRSSLAQPPQQLVLRVVRGNVPGTMVMR